MRCWFCGVEPNTWVDTSSLGSTFSTRSPSRWPPSEDGHEHAERAPSPGELEQAGHEALMRLRSQAHGAA